jgi:hypothetical protein
MLLVRTYRVRRKLVIVLGAVVLVLSVAVLVLLLWLSPPQSGLTRAQAVQAAWTRVDKGAVAVSSAEVRRDFNTGFDLPIHRWAWVVTFTGQWHLLCQGGPEGCDPTTEWVAIDYTTGDWIASQYSYPSGK